jgi:hypothetical protein
MSTMPTMKKKLHYHGETDNKLRWDGEAAGVLLELYVPKWRVPHPMPDTVEVRLSPASGIPGDMLPVTQEMVRRDPGLKEQPIAVVLKKGAGHTRTIRYNPIDPETAETGNVYVPFCLTFGGVQWLSLTVKWKVSS